MQSKIRGRGVGRERERERERETERQRESEPGRVIPPVWGIHSIIV